MIETMQAWRVAVGAGAILLCSGCYMYLTSIQLEEGTKSFSLSEEERAVSAVARAVEDLGFRRPSSEAVLRESEPGSAYAHRNLAAFSPPARYAGLSILVEIHTDRKSLRVSLRDAEHGSPTTEFADILERLRRSLEQSFPDARFHTESRRSFRFFAP